MDWIRKCGCRAQEAVFKSLAYFCLLIDLCPIYVRKKKRLTLKGQVGISRVENLTQDRRQKPRSKGEIGLGVDV